jgi:superoxide dismutase, Cu-Zn family
MHQSRTALAAALATLALTAACASLEGAGPAVKVALDSRSGSSVTGSLSLQQQDGGVRITGEVRGLAPASAHGFHVHEKGDCSAADASSAGPHFNPMGAPHGNMAAGPHHAGDMPNIMADQRGVARVDVLVPGATLAAGPGSITGRAIVVHRDPDDYATQPAGNAGPRVACGVIK